MNYTEVLFFCLTFIQHPLIHPSFMFQFKIINLSLLYCNWIYLIKWFVLTSQLNSLTICVCVHLKCMTHTREEGPVLLSYLTGLFSHFSSPPLTGTASRPLVTLPGAQPRSTHVCLSVVPHPLYCKVPPLHGFPHH